ncbi:hypothetical protein [Myroides odoratimimus]|uniref:hypothetical protein n=1 Tax=Myroides odoratimimus TaxID=76832 RepID=UPI002576155B|nr:hypothetical protein [Myroides odoratimimus]MDM1065423.1 hypothetical protein [Myroides odoratimimus]
MIKNIENIKVKELIDFHRKAEGKNKKRFAQKLRNREKKIIEKKEGGDNSTGGDYWISSRSCILNVFKTVNNGLYDNKVDELEIKLLECKHKNTKVNLERNIQMLEKFREFDLSELKPNVQIKYNIPIKKDIKEFTFKDLTIYLNPSTLYSYKKGGKDYIGALWLVSSKEGFKKSELGVFCELLYRLIVKEYGDKYHFEKEYCCAVDICNTYYISYSDIENKKITALLEGIIDKIKED